MKVTERSYVPKRHAVLAAATLLLAAVIVLMLGCSDENETDGDDPISTVKNGYLGEYTDLTVSEILDTSYKDLYENVEWDSGENDDGETIVQVKYFDDDELSVPATIQFKFKSPLVFTVSAFVDPLSEIKESSDLMDILNFDYLLAYMMKNSVTSGSEEEKTLLKRLNGISASSVLYGAGRKYDGDRSALSDQFGEKPIDVSVLWLLDSYGHIDMSLYDLSDLEDLAGSGSYETTITETTAAETTPAETTDDSVQTDYDNILPAYVCGEYTFLEGDGFGDSYTVNISENDRGTGGKYCFSVTFDLKANSNDFISGTMDLGKTFRFDGNNSIDEGELRFTFEGNKLYLTFSSKMHPKFKSVLEPKQKIDYTKIDFGKYCGTYFMPNGVCSITISDLGNGYYVDVFFDENSITPYDCGVIVPGESNLLDYGTILTLEVSFDGRLHASIISAIESDGSYDDYLTKTNTMCERGLTFEEECEKLSSDVSNEFSDLFINDSYVCEGEVIYNSERIYMKLFVYISYGGAGPSKDAYYFTVDYRGENTKNGTVEFYDIPLFYNNYIEEDGSKNLQLIFNLGDSFSEHAGMIKVILVGDEIYLCSNIENCADTGGLYAPVDLF